MRCFRIFGDHVAQVIFFANYIWLNENETMVYSLLMKWRYWYPCRVLSCSKTSIYKHCYQASHPYSDVQKEYHSYRRSLNTVGMGQNKQDLRCLYSEGVTVLHLATGIFQETHAPLLCNSSWDIVLTIICPSLKERQFCLYSWSILNATAFF